jgi:hypothetical protein
VWPRSSWRLSSSPLHRGRWPRHVPASSNFTLSARHSSHTRALASTCNCAAHIHVTLHWHRARPMNLVYNYTVAGAVPCDPFVVPFCRYYSCHIRPTAKTKLHGLSPRTNYTDLATAACRRTYCQLLSIEVVTWSERRFLTVVFSVF